MEVVWLVIIIVAIGGPLLQVELTANMIYIIMMAHLMSLAVFVKLTVYRYDVFGLASLVGAS